MPIMRHKGIQASRLFMDRIRQAEERLFADQFSENDASMMQSGGRRFWHFRPSHHIATGLMTEEDIMLLSQPGKRLLSVGASPAFLERILVELGVPPANVLLADNDPAIAQCAGPIPFVIFDATGAWPDIGFFDRIIFPESLCIAIGDRVRESGVEIGSAAGDHPTDAIETTLMTTLLHAALQRLCPGGILRANGPMSHPKVIRAVSAMLREAYPEIVIESRRFFLSIHSVPAVHF